VVDVLGDTPAGLDGDDVAEAQRGARVVDEEVGCAVEMLGGAKGVLVEVILYGEGKRVEGKGRLGLVQWDVGRKVEGRRLMKRCGGLCIGWI
jgi:hypothetical protein